MILKPLIENDTIFDRNRNIAILSGGIHHKHLTKDRNMFGIICNLGRIMLH